MGGRKGECVTGEAVSPAWLFVQLFGFGDIGEVIPLVIDASRGRVPALVGLGGGIADPLLPEVMVGYPCNPPLGPPEYLFGFGELAALLL